MVYQFMEERCKALYTNDHAISNLSKSTKAELDIKFSKLLNPSSIFMNFRFNLRKVTPRTLKVPSC